MSEESTVTNLPAEKDESSENGKMLEGNPSKPPLSSDDSPASENAETPAEQVNAQENRQLIKSDQYEEQNKSVLGSLENNVEADQNPEQQLSTSETSIEPKSLVRISDEQPSVESSEPKSLERISDVDPSSAKSSMSNESESLERRKNADQSSVKPPPSSEISPSKVPASDKGLEEVSDNIQLIYEGLKDMKISTHEVPVPASAKKGRKAPSTPRARSTPVKPLTSPPLTRSRSRDLRKFPSTPSSPKNSANRKTSESDSDEVKGARGRQRVKKN